MNGVMEKVNANASGVEMGRLREVCRERNIVIIEVDYNYKRGLLFLEDASIILMFKNIAKTIINSFLLNRF